MHWHPIGRSSAGFIHSPCLSEQERCKKCPRPSRRCAPSVTAAWNTPEFAPNTHVRSASLRRICLAFGPSYPGETRQCRICLRHICTCLAADVQRVGFWFTQISPVNTSFQVSVRRFLPGSRAGRAIVRFLLRLRHLRIGVRGVSCGRVCPHSWWANGNVGRAHRVL